MPGQASRAGLRIGLAVGLLVCAGPIRGAELTSLRVPGLGPAPDVVLIFIARGEGTGVLGVSLFSRAQRAVEEHMNARAISTDETGSELTRRRLAACKGDDRCYASLARAVDAKYLLVVTASLVGDVTVLGSRFIEIAAARSLGNALDAIPPGIDLLDVLPDRIRASVPAELWDPFGGLTIIAETGVEIAINGRPVGISPIGQIGFLSAGDYVIRATKADYQGSEQRVILGRGEIRRVSLTLTAAPSAAGWMGWAVAGGVVVVGGIAAALWLIPRGPATFCSSPDLAICP